MNKIILLDWDGPISNSRTWSMPGCVDPVAVQLLNEAFGKGWQVVLTSTIRKHHDSVLDFEASFVKAGIHPVWFDFNGFGWRTNKGFTSKRHIEVMQWFHDYQNIIGDDDVFLAIDDEDYPIEMCERLRIVDYPVDCDNGIGFRSLKAMREFINKTDDELKEYFDGFCN